MKLHSTKHDSTNCFHSISSIVCNILHQSTRYTSSQISFGFPILLPIERSRCNFLPRSIFESLSKKSCTGGKLTSFSKAEARAVEALPVWAGEKAAAPATRAERAARRNMLTIIDETKSKRAELACLVLEKSSLWILQVACVPIVVSHL